MNKSFRALCYEAGLWAIQRWPWIALLPNYQTVMMAWRPSWEEWKVQLTLQKVDEQTVLLKEQWEKEEREHRAEALATKAQELFPDATITPLPDAVVPSVMIIHEAPADASDAIKALGGELRITWQLND